MLRPVKFGILTRYIFKEIIQCFFIALFAFTAMLLALNILKFTSLIINKGVSASQIAMVFLTLIPTFLEIAIPMSALLGVMLAFARLSGDSEIVVMRASGISIFKLASPVIAFGAIVTAMSLYVSIVARPWGYENLSQTLYSIASSSSVAGLDEGVFSKLGMLTVYAAKVDHQTGNMTKVLLDDRRDPETRKIVFAKSGSIVSDPETKRIVFYLKDGEIHELIEGKYAVTHFLTNASVLDPQDLFSDDAAKKGRQFNAMSLHDLSEMKAAYTDILNTLKGGAEIKTEITLPFGQKLLEGQATIKEVGKRINRTRIEGQRRFSMPYAAFMLALVGMSLGIQPPRTQKTWGIGLSAAFGVGVFVIYYGFLSVGIAMSEGNKLDPLLGLWLPNLVITALALWALRQVGTERWNSISHGIDEIVRSLRARFQS